MISLHFTEKELKCPCCGQNHVTKEILEVAEYLRAQCGPLKVHSGYRCTAHNKAVGGSPRSQHMLGRALDISSPTFTPLKLYQLIKRHWTLGQLPTLGGLGLYSWGVHIDVRRSDTLIIW